MSIEEQTIQDEAGAGAGVLAPSPFQPPLVGGGVRPTSAAERVLAEKMLRMYSGAPERAVERLQERGYDVATAEAMLAWAELHVARRRHRRKVLNSAFGLCGLALLAVVILSKALSGPTGIFVVLIWIGFWLLAVKRSG